MEKWLAADLTDALGNASMHIQSLHHQYVQILLVLLVSPSSPQHLRKSFT